MGRVFRLVGLKWRVKAFSARRHRWSPGPYENKCVGLAEINTLLQDLTYVYLDKGFITSRATCPTGHREDQTLRLIVVEGLLSDIYLNGKPGSLSGVLATAFPGMKHIVNMRDIEQGLDQINRLSSNNAKTAMLPGTDEWHLHSECRE